MPSGRPKHSLAIFWRVARYLSYETNCASSPVAPAGWLQCRHADPAYTTGDLISKNLWSGTCGGPHLHFEIRYYRPADNGTEEFYGFRESVPGAGDWPYGKWDPDVGYGFGDPKSHGLSFR